jgi:hypothetical protein
MKLLILKLIILAAFSLPEAFAIRSPSTYFQLKNDLLRTSQKELLTYVNELVNVSRPSRMIGKEGHEKSHAWILEEIKKLDPKVSGKLIKEDIAPDLLEAKRFYESDLARKKKTGQGFAKWQKYTEHMIEKSKSLSEEKVQNIIWEKSGLDSDKVLIITAHYDTISHDPSTLLVREDALMPGANFNASGVAVALGLLKTFAKFKLNYSVQIVFLDWQGVGFLGSYHHAKMLKDSKKEILGVLNLEMLGQDTTYLDKTKKLGNMKLYLNQNEKDEIWASNILRHGKKMTSRVDFAVTPNNFNDSDNFRYSDMGFRALTFSQDWENDFNPKFYQTSQDTPETLNHLTLYHNYLFLGGVSGGILLDLTK